MASPSRSRRIAQKPMLPRIFGEPGEVVGRAELAIGLLDLLAFGILEQRDSGGEVAARLVADARRGGLRRGRHRRTGWRGRSGRPAAGDSSARACEACEATSKPRAAPRVALPIVDG